MSISETSELMAKRCRGKVYWAEKMCCVNENVVIDYVSLLGRENVLCKRERCDRLCIVIGPRKYVV